MTLIKLIFIFLLNGLLLIVGITSAIALMVFAWPVVLSLMIGVFINVAFNPDWSR